MSETANFVEEFLHMFHRQVSIIPKNHFGEESLNKKLLDKE